MARPCVHGEVCRAYMRRFGILAILSKKCPKGCEFYEPKESNAA